MKQIFTFLTMLMFVFPMNAQYIYNDFDANQNEEFSGWPNVPVIIGNPDASGINTSANVAQFDKTDWATWDHASAELPGKIDFTTGTTFSVKVHSPIACDVLFKIEDKTNGAIFAEELLSVSTTNTWVQLDFDFTGASSDTYDKIVIFLDFASTAANTFYFDDVEGPGYEEGGPDPVATLELPITFDVDTAEYNLVDFGGNLSEIIEDPDNSDNNIVKTIKQDFAELWAGTTVGEPLGLATPIAFTPDSTVLSMKVWSPEVGIPIRYKIEDSNNPAISVETEAVTTVANEWETLFFNFANPVAGAPINFDNDYNKPVIFFNFGTTGADAGEQTYYWDDLDGVFPGPSPTVALPITFEIDTVDYDLIDFGGNMSEIIEDPTDSDNHVVQSVKQDFAELWAGTTVAGSLGLVEPLPFAQDSTHMSVRVWSPEAGIPIRLKAENISNGGIFVETEANTSIAMEWDTLIFNFGAPATGSPAINFDSEYNLLSIFFNFGTTGADAGEQTYYWDDVTWIGALPPKPLLELNVQDNFEDDGWGTIEQWYFEDPDLNELVTTTDPDDQNNTVADYNRTGAFPYTNAQFILDHRMDLTERNKFELDVYFPSSNDYSGGLNPTAAVKLQNSLMGGNAWMTQTEILITVEDFDQWVTLLFDFSAIADSVNYDQVVVQLGGEAHNDPGQFYFDNFYLKHVPVITVLSPNGGEQILQGSSFEIEWDYEWWDGEIDIELIKDGGDPEPLAFGWSVSDSSFTWNIFPDQEPGTDYRIILVSLDDAFPTDTSDAFFTILEVDGVLANFEAEPTQTTVGDSITFTNMSLGQPDTWIWEFEGGTPETYNGENPPKIVYETAGTFDVTLTVYNGGDENQMIKEDYISIGVVSANFEASETQILTGQTIDFTNLSEGQENAYQWSFEGGEPATSTEENPTGVLYNEVGVFSVTLIATNTFGTDTLEMTEYIAVTPVGIDSYSQNPIHVYPNPAGNQLYVSLPNAVSFDVYLKNLNGQEIYALKGQKNMIQLNTSSYNSGIYLLMIRNSENGEVTMKKIMIK